ncbi:hypothetical protein Hamer_G003056 [Homarus americanus]|uniref:Integrase p58-like C-terminal domain-containing protein n=1 Tax=Homarus americanus TaxID=6706 RepID=A0A8J5T934_HOMAM|nr:hypothetical protein Hamer_G003056 [Homarus americanus]
MQGKWCLATRLGVVKPGCQQRCRREALPKKCNHTTVEKNPGVAGEGLEKMQQGDQDLQPAWETISGLNPTTKNYWAQWEALRLKGGLLQCHLQERLTEVHHQVRGALEFSGEVMKRNHDVKASQVCFKDGDKVWLYNPLRKKDVTYRIRGRRKAQPKVVHVNRLWQYHGSGQYTWEDSEEQSPTTDEAQT